MWAALPQAILAGDHRPFIAALVVPDRQKIAAALAAEETELTDQKIEFALQSRIDQINSRLEEPEKIRKFTVINADFPVEVRSLTAFQKVKVNRQVVEQQYQSEINKIYSTVSNGGDV